MRQIKFRGKDLNMREEHDGGWEYGTFIPSEDGSEAYIMESRFAIDPSPTSKVYLKICPVFLIGVVPETVGQYIGLKDKNGNELYEGDIVQAFDAEFKGSFKGVIKFGDGSFYIDELNGITNYRWQDYEVELMGNIYDNPELLEVV